MSEDEKEIKRAFEMGVISKEQKEALLEDIPEEKYEALYQTVIIGQCIEHSTS